MTWDDRFEVVKVFDAVTIAANGNKESDAIDFTYYRPNGYFSLQVAVTGDGTCKFEYLISNDDVNYLDPSTATDIASSITKTSGTGGKDIYSFEPIPGQKMKIKCTETGTANSVTVTAHLLVQ